MLDFSHAMLDISAEAALWALAISAFLSATFLPGNSEIALLATLAKFPNAFWQAIVVATAANTLGGMVTYALGRLVPNRAQGRALAWLRKYGEWALLLSWVPLVGDALCVAAGWLRMDARLAVLMLAIGKCARYLAVAGGWAWIMALR